MTSTRAAEEAAIAAHIAAHGVTRLDEVDPVERALEQWRAEQAGKKGVGNGLRAMMEARRRARRVKATPVVPPPAPVALKPKRSYKKKRAAAVPVNEPWYAAALRGPKVAPPSVAEPVSAELAGSVEPDRGTIADLAYALWERDGWAHGRDVEHWLTAEAAILRRAR